MHTEQRKDVCTSSYFYGVLTFRKPLSSNQVYNKKMYTFFVVHDHNNYITLHK